MSLSKDSTEHWNSAFNRVVVAIEKAVRQRAIINAMHEAKSILEEYQIPVDAVALKAIVDGILVLAVEKDIPVQLGD